MEDQEQQPVGDIHDTPQKPQAVHADVAPRTGSAGVSHPDDGRLRSNVVGWERGVRAAQSVVLPGDRFIRGGANQRAGLCHGDVAGFWEGELLALEVHHQCLDHGGILIFAAPKKSDGFRAQAQEAWCLALLHEDSVEQYTNARIAHLPAQDFKDGFFGTHLNGGGPHRRGEASAHS